jgi:hypothetical protein
MIVNIKRNEGEINTEYMSIDLGLVDDEDIAEEARERDYVVMERLPFTTLYEKHRQGQNIDIQLRELFMESIGRIV